MSFKLPGIERRIALSPLRLLGIFLLIPLAWVAYVGFNFWQLERNIQRDLPTEVLARFTPEPEGTPVAFIVPTSPPQPTQAPDATATTVPGEPTPYDPGVVLPKAQKGVPTPSPSESSIKDWNGKKRVTMLFLGVDQRDEGTTRPDTIILASLDFEQNRAYILSVPRDLYVKIPGGYGYWKINAAYPIGEKPEHREREGGGVGLLIKTLQQNFGIETPEEYAIVNFNGFTQGVDALGGIYINIPDRLVDRRYPNPEPQGKRFTTVVFEKGEQHMLGERALRYARIRHADNDFGRIQRQQQVILAIQQKARNPATIAKAPQLLDVVEGNLQTSLSLVEQVRLARWGASLPKEHIEFYYIPGKIAAPADQPNLSAVFAEPKDVDPILRKVFGPGARLRR